MTQNNDEKMALAPGLYVTGTPIGNLKDMTLRAIEVLKAVDRIACEDSRVAGVLLRHFGIDTPLTTYHDHNAAAVRPKLLQRLAEGEAIALISDAGMPLISDPGYRLVREAQDAGVKVYTVPGPAAAIAALSIAGLATDHFYFEGFLPTKAKARAERLAALKPIDASLIFYESPKRLAVCLAAMADTLGPREAAVARELTKAFEEVRRGDLADLARHYAEAGPPKGEIVVVVGPPIRQGVDWEAIEAKLRDLLPDHRLKEAVDLVTAESGAPRRAVYQRALAIKKGEE